MDELEQKIIEIYGKPTGYQFTVIAEFISKCSLSDFEKLKDLEYEMDQTKEYSFCNCYRAKGCDIDENGDLYCIECQKNISQ